MIRLKIPTALRAATDAAGVVEVEAATVRAALTAAIERHPDLEARLFDEHGQLRRFLNVFVDEEDIRFERGLDTPVASGQTVSLLPAVAGGRGETNVVGGRAT
jgi:sulfur-carrier protein